MMMQVTSFQELRPLLWRSRCRNLFKGLVLINFNPKRKEEVFGLVESLQLSLEDRTSV